MKTVAIIFITLLTIQGFAQKYNSVIENNDSLRILFNNVYEGETQSICIDSDTVINSQFYSKLNFDYCNREVFIDVECSPDYISDYNSECLQFSTYDLFLREDSTKSNLFIYSGFSNKEYLIMDLTLNKSDSFKVITPNYDSIYYKVDSIFTMDGKKVIQFDKERSIGIQSKLQFIEGIALVGDLFMLLTKVTTSFFVLIEKEI